MRELTLNPLPFLSLEHSIPSSKGVRARPAWKQSQWQRLLSDLELIVDSCFAFLGPNFAKFQYFKVPLNALCLVSLPCDIFLDSSQSQSLCPCTRVCARRRCAIERCRRPRLGRCARALQLLHGLGRRGTLLSTLPNASLSLIYRIYRRCFK